MINFLKYKYLYFVISALVIFPGLFSLLKWGLRPSIDFTGGTVWELKFESPVNREEVNKFFSDNADQNFGLATESSTGLILKFKPLSQDQKNQVSTNLTSKFGEFTETRFETMGPLLGKELITKTVVGVALAAILIMLYIVYQFHDRLFGVSAILAMFHDTLVMLGVFSLLGHFFGVEIDTLFVTAVLTILSFSTHDTVVVYDRIRELLKIYPNKTLPEQVNIALNETAVRSLNNSLTIIFMLMALVLLGGSTVKTFAIALLVGTISGTYSSMFTASPLLVVWHEYLSKQKVGGPRRFFPFGNKAGT